MDARLTSLTACVALALAACVNGTSQGVQGGGEPLAGQIYRVGDGAQVDEAALVADASRADFVLIGERHDNPEHHRLLAALVAALETQGRAPRAVAFEMIPAGRQLEIVEYLAAKSDLGGLGEVVAWEESGWPDWSWYQPVAEAAVANDAQIVAADLGTAEKRAAFVQGSQAFRATFVRRTGLGEAWPAPLMVSLQDELRAAVCDQAPGWVVIGMMRVQRARDAMMADRLAATAGKGGGLLIAGNPHVRKDRGVPWYLARLRPGARGVSIALLEVQDDARAPAADLPYDYVWYTPRQDRDGVSCEGQDSELERLLQAG
ncbi:MAG TPA: ChaN family lipoprotein [Geminicoccaceae bacterium]|nr:ChaN family lipoprotein [Geminicoccaceae bacterium]